MLEEGVVESAEDIDVAMILGAGWPFLMGGLTPYLDRTGAVKRPEVKPFTTHPSGVFLRENPRNLGR